MAWQRVHPCRHCVEQLACVSQGSTIRSEPAVEVEQQEESLEEGRPEELEDAEEAGSETAGGVELGSRVGLELAERSRERERRRVDHERRSGASARSCASTTSRLRRPRPVGEEAGTPGS